MLSTKTTLRPWLAGIILVSLVLILSACGWKTEGQSSGPNTGASSPSDKPEKLQIEVNELVTDSGQKKPVLTVTTPDTIQKLYTNIYASGWMPEQQACTDELGPSYTLTFFQAGKELSTMKVERYGCRPISITGEARQRRSSQDFWTLLDKAIYEGAPPAQVETVAFMRIPAANQPAQSARITTAQTAQRLYDAIVKLPLFTDPKSCPDEPAYDYQFVFTAKQQTIPATLDNRCGVLNLIGNYQSRGGTYKTDEAFSKLFTEIVGSATFTAAQPDRLTLATTNTQTSKQAIVGDGELIRKLYNAFYGLPVIERLANCPSGKDKEAGKGTHYMLDFAQWNLPLLHVEAYEGSCTTVYVPSTMITRQGNPAFWELVHQADRAA